MDKLEQTAYNFMNQDTYICYLNGKFYGIGGLEYVRELFVDYVVACEMYGRKECEFKIVKNVGG